jgi:proteic killer suppression protein
MPVDWKQFVVSDPEILRGKPWFKLDRLEAATSLADLAALPGNRFEALRGDRKGQYSIRINDQWRVCFEWPSGAPGPTNVEIVDYH